MKKTSTYVYVRVQRVQGLDRQAERTATLTLASCVLLLLLLCCGRRTVAVDQMSYISTRLVVEPVAKKKLFLLDKTCEIQIFRPQIILVPNFNHKTLLHKTYQVLCVLQSFYPSTSSTTSVRAVPQSPRPERYYYYYQ